MLANKVVIEAFVNGCNYVKNKHLSCEGNKLFSYNTCIAEFDEYGTLYINFTRYSNSTSTHRGILVREVAPMPYTKVEDIPIGTQSLIKR